MTKYDWLNIMKLSVAKIKSFFSNTLVNIQGIIQGASYEITNNGMEKMDIDYAKEKQEDMEDLSLQDL